MRLFFFVFGDGFKVVAQTGISEPEMIVAKRNVPVKSQRGLELLNRLHGTIRVLITTAQQHMSYRGVRVEPYGFFQFLRSRRMLVLREQYQRYVEVNVEPRAVQALGTAQPFQGLCVLT